MNCPNCGTVNVDAARFCVNCGQPLVKACANCGTELPATARFCHNCGRPQAAGNPIARTTANPTFSAGEATALLTKARTLTHTTGDRAAEARILWNLLLLSTLEGGDPEERLRFGLEALAIARDLELSDLTPLLLHDLWYAYGGLGRWLPAARLHLLAEDAIIHMFLKGEPPLFESTWAGRTGASLPQMRATTEWVRAVRVDVLTVHAYARAVADSAETMVAGLSADDLARTLDLSAQGLGHRTVSWIFNALIIGHLNNMAGEISCLKGLQGAKGYPF